MAEPKFILIGSLPRLGAEAKDIDLVLPFDDASRGRIGLGRYEELAHETGKPVDLFLQPPVPGSQLAAVFSPNDRRPQWVIFHRHCDEIISWPELVTFERIVELAGKRPHELRSEGRSP